MKEVTKIGAREVKVLTLIYMSTKIILDLPRVFIETGATAGWMLPLLSGAFSLVLWFMISGLLERYPGQNIIRINEKVAGRVPGFIINLLILIYVIYTGGILLREFSDAVLISALPDTPISIVSILFIITILIACYFGLEPIVRSAYIFYPLLAIGSLLVLLSMVPYFDFTQIYPFFGSGLKNILYKAVPYSSAFGEVLILLILVSYFSFEPKVTKQIGTQSIIITSLTFVIITLVYQLVIPYPSSTESYLPFYQMARSVDLGRFFHRLEAAYVLIWAVTAYIRMSTAMFVSAYLYKEIFRIPLHKPLIPAIAILFFTVSIAPKSIVESIQIEMTRLMVGGLFAFGLPILILIIAMLRKKEERDEDVKKKG